MGFNVKDNYLYAYDVTNNNIIRIHGDGTSEVVSTIAAGIGLRRMGDIDSDGQMWLAPTSGAEWAQIDLAQIGSATYGKVVASGLSITPLVLVADWVHIPVAGDYLYSVGSDQISGVANLVRFSRSTHLWSNIGVYPSVIATLGTNRAFGALYGMNNGTGTIYALDNSSGKIYQFPIGGQPFQVSKAAISSLNDGARCVNNLLL